MDKHRDEPAEASRASDPAEGTQAATSNDVTSVSSPPRQPVDANEGREEEERAAHVIQRVYRGYKTRRELKGRGIDASARWREVMREAEWRQANRPREPIDAGDGDLNSDGVGSGHARQNWKRVVNIAKRAGCDDDVSQEPSPGRRGSNHPQPDTGIASMNERDGSSASKRHSSRHSALFGDVDIPPNEMAKVMDLQYFLEMVDLKHRYGSNLRNYHTYWKNSSSKQNFFYWLDYGEGKDVDLPRCPRERLDREQVRYLSREERMQYLVTVDEAGRFRWARNGERVWTDSSRFKDSLKGVVPKDEPAPRFVRHNSDGVPIVQAAESSSSGDSEEEGSSSSDNEQVKRYVNPDFDEAKGVKKFTYVRPAVIFNHLMRESLKKEDMWIFVADTSWRIYIGIKESGAFQHSSFLSGARIAAAGLMKIRDGQLRSLSPMSGHYRPPPSNFRAFVHALEDQGVDMSKVSISKSYAILVGIEGYKRIKKKKRALRDRLDTKMQKMQSQHEAAGSKSVDQGTLVVETKHGTEQHAHTKPTEPRPESSAEPIAGKAAGASHDLENPPRSSDHLVVPAKDASQPEDGKATATTGSKAQKSGTIWDTLKKIAHHRKSKNEADAPPSIDAGVTKVEHHEDS